MQPLKVLVVTLRYPPYVAGGYELLTRDAVEALRERGHEVHVLAGRGARFADQPDTHALLEPGLDEGDDLFALSHQGSNLDRLRLHVYSGANRRATRRALEESGAEVLFYFNLGLVSLAPLVAARLGGVPTLGFASDPWPANHWLRDWREDPRQRTKRLRLWLLERFWGGFRSLVGLGRLFTCSSFLRDHLLESGVDASTTEVLHLGVPPDVTRAARNTPSPERAGDEPLRVLCLSSFWKGKGQDVLLEAVATARRGGAPIELVLAGSGGGAFREELEARARRDDLAGGVRFEEGLDRAGVSALLARSPVLALPSTWGEPFPLATLEGMAHGLAVTVSDAGGSAEAVEEGVTGFVTPAGDAPALAQSLLALEADEGLRRRVAAAGREHAETTLSHARFVDALETALFEATGRGRERSA